MFNTSIGRLVMRSLDTIKIVYLFLENVVFICEFYV